MSANNSLPKLGHYSGVWAIYDDYRTSLFNEKYFEKKLSSLQSKALYLDLVIAVGTSTTGIAGWALWNKPEFAAVWAGFAGIAATLTIIKPILKWDEHQVKFAKLFSEHRRVSTAYGQLVNDLAVRQGLDDDILRRHGELVQTTTDIEAVPQGPRSLLIEIQSEINRWKPADRFWSPPKPEGGG